MAQAKIAPNGKSLFNEALPARDGGHVAILREMHYNASHHEYTKEHIGELVKEHNLGTIALEQPPYMMLLIWAHRDGKLGNTPEKNDKALEQAFVSVMKEEFRDKAIAEAALVSRAHKMGVNVITFDSRKLDSEKTFSELQVLEHLKEHDVLTGMQISGGRLATLQQADLLYRLYPEYQMQLDAIEKAGNSMKGVPSDAVSAALASTMADPRKNMLVIIGEAHVNGELSHDAGAQGIVDDALAKQGWKVHDLKIGSQADIEDQINMRTGIDSYLLGGALIDCESKDHVDAIYLTDKDQIIQLPREVSKEAQKAYTWHDSVEGLSKDVFSCTDSPPVEKIYKPEQLAPELPAESLKEIQEIRESMWQHKDDSGKAAPTKQKPSTERHR